MVKPISPARRNRGDTVAARLRREILLGRHRPGERLPPERELAARLGTNRNTLREALRTLESENLVRARQGDGTLVLDWRAEGEITLLPAFLFEETAADERLHELMTLLRLRERLLDEALTTAAERAAPADLDAVSTALEALRAAPRKGMEAISADVEVYRRLVHCASSLVLTWTFNTFARTFLEIGSRFTALWTIDDDYLQGLEQVLERVREGRADKARERMQRVFLERGFQFLEAVPETKQRKAKP
jgi:DNA-binding FadR family transcriptional regulator